MSTSSITDQRIFTELTAAAKKYEDWDKLKIERIHIAVMAEPFLSLVLNGKKTVESRFSLHRVAPYRRVQTGDLVLMKAGPIVGCFTVKWAQYFDLTVDSVESIRKTYGDEICSDEPFWQQAATKRYVSLLGVTDVRRLTPVTISKTDRRGWVSQKAETSSKRLSL